MVTFIVFSKLITFDHYFSAFQFYFAVFCPISSLSFVFLTFLSSFPDLCDSCALKPHESLLTSVLRFRDAQRRHVATIRVCQNCIAYPDPEIACESLDCSVLFERKRSSRELLIAEELMERMAVTVGGEERRARRGEFDGKGGEKRENEEKNREQRGEMVGEEEEEEEVPLVRTRNAGAGSSPRADFAANK